MKEKNKGKRSEGVMEELQREYGQMGTGAIMGRLRQLQAAARHNYHQFIRLLFYVQKDQRWKELPGYAKVPWAEFLRNEFNLTEANFRKQRIALINYPQESSVHGVGFVARVVDQVDAVKAGAVFGELEEGMPQKKKEAVITRHAQREERPVPVSRGELRRRIEVLQERNKEMAADLKTERAQRVRAQEALRLAYRRINELEAEKVLAGRRLLLRQTFKKPRKAGGIVIDKERV